MHRQPESCSSTVFPLAPTVAVRVKKSVKKNIVGPNGKAMPNQTVHKFKIRCSRYLYTLSVTDAAKAEKIQQSLPPGPPLLCFVEARFD